ncbi:hypothetical protein H8Z72_09790 [Xanthomonas citri pv. citri]|nr:MULTISPECIES: hypothetical protein [Xanthomonas]MBD1509630.1 hypothetical protein [Xanthomonas citri pv. citri]MBD4011184.1 hypothetical protein [Xanthomonas citri pv. citri]MBD4080465.1 hypothetical protein [Xanthomonas citri pv. citri]MBD4087116.1 hypothetical protein [Xanthomonas citri pv. citri]MBD4108257.1 hypothetical protein [Xanthomonas citri pv. citri]
MKSKAKHVRDLTDYIRDPEKTNPDERSRTPVRAGSFATITPASKAR